MILSLLRITKNSANGIENFAEAHRPDLKSPCNQLALELNTVGNTFENNILKGGKY